MVIGQHAGLCWLDARGPEHREKRFGLRDACDSDHRLRRRATHRPQATARAVTPDHLAGETPLEVFSHDARKPQRAQHQVGGPRPGLAQGTSGQQPTIADAPCIEHANLQIARQRQMLQSVVADQHLGVGVASQEKARRVDPARAHDHRHLATAGNQQRLIARQRHVGVIGPHLAAGAAAPASIPTRNHTHAQALGSQVFDDRNDDGRLARATSHNVADDHHRNGQTLRPTQPEAIQRPMQAGQRAIQAR